MIFDEALDEASRRLRSMQSELKEAIRSGGLALHFQSIVSTAARRPMGFEALARWQRDNGEWVSPGEFIPLAERTGMISEISLWALRTAAAAVSRWRQHAPDIYVSINVAAESFTDERFLAELENVIQEYSLAPGQLKLELTETMLMNQGDDMLARLDYISGLGYELMLDDFGTGYSSLAVLNRLPIDTVKIDKSFVADLAVNQQAAAVVTTIVSLAEQLGMAVICEGVETQAQARELHNLGCYLMQGFMFTRPMPVADADAFVIAKAHEMQPPPSDTR